jgi:pilus assembly protein TadC
MSFAAALCVTAAVLAGRSGRARLRLPSPQPRIGQDSLTRPRSLGRLGGLSLASLAAVLLAVVGPVAVGISGVVVGVALVARRRTARRNPPVAIDVGLCIDLLGAAMACGAAPSAALSAVARGVAGPGSEALAEAATALALGADPAQAWSGVGAAVPQLARAARACARAASSGAGVSQELFRQAAVARADEQVVRRRRLQRAGVWLVLPLGLCFLPAFVLVGVVPVVLSAVPGLAG